MRSKIISRREFFNNIGLVITAACFSGCTKTVTRYHADGTPYTVEEEDAVLTLAAILLGLLIVGAIAASRSDDDSDSSFNDEDERQNPLRDGEEIQLASMTSKCALPASDNMEDISIKDSKGTLLIMADASEHVTYRDPEAGKSLLALAQISNLKRPISIRLKQSDLNSYSVERICPIRKSLSKNNPKVLHRSFGEELYEIKVHGDVDGYVDLEIASGVSSKSIA